MIMLEKAIIIGAWLCTIPLVFLDKELLSFRRYVWIVAACCGLYTTLVVDDPTAELAGYLDKISMACVSITIVPHFVELVRHDFWMGICVVPPFFLVVHLSLETTINSDEFWKLRSFLHMGLFLPYLNHLPSTPSTTTPGEGNGTEGSDSKKGDSNDKSDPDKSATKKTTTETKKTLGKTNKRTKKDKKK